MDLFKRVCNEKVDVGGWKCPCCAPAPKHRQKFRRRMRHRLHDRDRVTVFAERDDT